MSTKKTPVEETIDMLKMGLELSTIALCFGVSETYAAQLIRLAKKEIAAEKEERREYNMRYNLPGQIERARAKVAYLEAKARRFGMTDLIENRP